MDLFDNKKLERKLDEVLCRLDKILDLLASRSKPVTSFVITGELMNINPGQGTVLTAVPLDASGATTTLPAGDVPVWATDTPGSVTVSPDPTGLILTVKVLATAPAGNINFQITDGVITTAVGTFQLTVVAVAPPPPNPVASFAVTGSAPA